MKQDICPVSTISNVFVVLQHFESNIISILIFSAAPNNNNNIYDSQQIGIMHPIGGSIIVTTATNSITCNPYNTSPSLDHPILRKSKELPKNFQRTSDDQFGRIWKSSITTTTNEPKFSSQSSSSYHRRHSVSVVAANCFSVVASNALTVSHQRALSLPITTTASPNDIQSNHSQNFKMKSTIQLTNCNKMANHSSSSSHLSATNIYNNTNTNMWPSSSQNTKSNHISCFHQRTRSLPLTEEEAIFPSVSSSSSSSLLYNSSKQLSGLYPKNSIPSLSSMHSSSNSSITTTGMESNGSSILQKLCENLCTQRNPDGSRKHQSKCCFYQLEQQQQYHHQQQQQNRLMFVKSHPCSMNQNSNNQTDPNDSTYLLMTSTLANRKGMNNSMDCIDENRIFSTNCAPTTLLANCIIDDQHHQIQHNESQINKTIPTSSGIGHSTNQTEIDKIYLPIIIITSNTDYQNTHSLTVSSTISHTTLTISGRSSCCKQTGCMY